VVFIVTDERLLKGITAPRWDKLEPEGGKGNEEEDGDSGCDKDSSR
jgi:hypothetical protein